MRFLIDQDVYATMVRFVKDLGYDVLQVPHELLPKMNRYRMKGKGERKGIRLHRQSIR